MKFSFGKNESNLGEYAWFEKNASKVGQEYAHRVRLKKANAWGLFDMHGNVWEWCSDWYSQQYGRSHAVDPQGPKEGEERVMRGGSWLNHAMLVRSANRNSEAATKRSFNDGFRAALTFPEPPHP